IHFVNSKNSGRGVLWRWDGQSNRTVGTAAVAFTGTEARTTPPSTPPSDGASGSLLLTMMAGDPDATPESASDAVTVPTCTILSFGGQIAHEPGMPRITGAVASILNASVWVASTWPTLSLARTSVVCFPPPLL